MVTLERKKEHDQFHDEIGTEDSGCLGSQDTFYVGAMKGVGHMYQQTCLDTSSEVAFAKLCNMKTPITAADLINDRVLSFFQEHKLGILILGSLTDRGTEFCGKYDSDDYELFLAIHDIDYSKTKTKHPQTNGTCEGFHRTILEEFYQIAFRKKLYDNLDELPEDLDPWITYHNSQHTHQGKMCCRRTPLQTLLEGKLDWIRKVDNLNQNNMNN
ncbi:MAG: integrase core domain-containing protein [Verrucomicrobiota bacterium]